MDVIVTALHTWTLEYLQWNTYKVGLPSKVFPKELQQLQLESAHPLRFYKVGM